MPLSVRPAAVTAPVRVAELEPRVKIKAPEVENPARVGLRTEPFPMVMGELPATKVPLLMKLPPSVSAKLLVARVVPAPTVRLPLMVAGAEKDLVPVPLTSRLL